MRSHLDLLKDVSVEQELRDHNHIALSIIRLHHPGQNRTEPSVWRATAPPPLWIHPSPWLRLECRVHKGAAALSSGRALLGGSFLFNAHISMHRRQEAEKVGGERVGSGCGRGGEAWDCEGARDWRGHTQTRQAV